MPVADVPSLHAIGPGDFVCIAHRGAASLAPENTLEAYRAAHASGLRLLEQDVRLLADGTLVVMHDERVDRLTGSTGNVCDFDLAAWRALRIDTQRWPAFASRTDVALPLFDEVLSEFKGRAVFVPEAKDAGSGAPLVRALRAFAIPRDQALVQSFLLDELPPAIDAGYPSIYLTRSVDDLDEVRALGVAWIGLPHAAPDAVFRTWMDAGFRVVAWTVDDHGVRDRLLGLGVQGVFSDDPLALLAGLPPGLRCVR